MAVVQRMAQLHSLRSAGNPGPHHTVARGHNFVHAPLKLAFSHAWTEEYLFASQVCFQACTQSRPAYSRSGVQISDTCASTSTAAGERLCCIADVQKPANNCFRAVTRFVSRSAHRWPLRSQRAHCSSKNTIFVTAALSTTMWVSVNDKLDATRATRRQQPLRKKNKKLIRCDAPASRPSASALSWAAETSDVLPQPQLLVANQGQTHRISKPASQPPRPPPRHATPTHQPVPQAHAATSHL